MHLCSICGEGPVMGPMFRPCQCGSGGAVHVACLGRWRRAPCPHCHGTLGAPRYALARLLAQAWLPAAATLCLMLGITVVCAVFVRAAIPPERMVAERMTFFSKDVVLLPTPQTYLLLGLFAMGLCSAAISAVYLCCMAAVRPGACADSTRRYDTCIFIGDPCPRGGGSDDDGKLLLVLCVLLSAAGLAAATFYIYYEVYAAIERLRASALAGVLDARDLRSAGFGPVPLSERMGL